MVLHIALDGIDGVGKTTLLNMLNEHYNIDKHDYNCCIAKQPFKDEIIKMLEDYTLLNHEIALLMAFDRSFAYYRVDWNQYDLVFWDRSVLSSYVYNTDDTVTEYAIRQFNRFFPEMDLYIIIEALENQDNEDLIKKYHKLINPSKNIYSIQYQKDKQEQMLNEIINLIEDKLPTCKFCGRLFKPNFDHRYYCSEYCSKESNMEQNRENNRKYFKRHKDTLSERSRGALGSKGANLHGKPNPDPLVELQRIRNAKKALGLSNK